MNILPYVVVFVCGFVTITLLRWNWSDVRRQRTSETELARATASLARVEQFVDAPPEDSNLPWSGEFREGFIFGVGTTKGWLEFEVLGRKGTSLEDLRRTLEPVTPEDEVRDARATAKPKKCPGCAVDVPAALDAHLPECSVRQWHEAMDDVEFDDE